MMAPNLSPSTPVGEVMVAGVLSLDPDDNVGRARQLMLSHGIHCLPVVDREGTVVGFVTSSDLVEEWPPGEAVDTIMSRVVHSVDVDDSVAEAASIMLAERVHHLLVTRKGRPVAVVSSFDLLRIVAATDAASTVVAGPTNLSPMVIENGA